MPEDANFLQYVMGRREQENRKRKAAVKSCQSLSTWVSKVPPLSAMTAQLKPRLQIKFQLTTFLQRDMGGGKSYLFSQCPPVLIPLLIML